MKILCIEDDKNVTDGLKILCEFQGMDVDVFNDGLQGLKSALETEYDVIVLDIMLPSVNGFEILSQLRRNGSTTPILMLTARGTIDDKVKSLNLGADDYMVKPFSAKEFFARVRALSRRKKDEEVQDDNVLTFNDLVFYPYRNVLELNGQNIRLTHKEARILELFLRNTNKILSRENIIERVWGYQTEIDKNNLEIYIHRLRDKLKDSKARISTIRKMGYILENNF